MQLRWQKLSEQCAEGKKDFDLAQLDPIAYLVWNGMQILSDSFAQDKTKLTVTGVNIVSGDGLYAVYFG